MAGEVSLFMVGIVLSVLTTIFFHTAIILFGAPVIDTMSETGHLSALLTVFTAMPCCLAHGVFAFPWIDSESHETTIAAFSIVGAWLGAVPIPLDWDRPWQVWPITCVIGACGGQAVGLVYSMIARNKYKDDKFKLG